MKKTLLILSIITIFFAGCKKDVEPVASKLEMTNETIERGWDYVKITAEYEYPVELKSIVLYLSENEDMSGARTYSCKIEGKTFSVEVDGLEEGRDYYCYFEFDDGYNKVKGEKYDVMTISKPIVLTKDVTNKTTTSATLNGSVTNDADNKIVARGFCWSMEPNVTIEDESINNGGSSGAGTSTFSHNLTNLKYNTTYYYKAYATTELGVCYGEEKSFKMVEVTLPTVTTNDVTNITTNTASCGGNVTDDGNGTVTARGICWSEVQNPTINNIYSEETNNGTGTGSFTSQLTNLKENTTYYVRAYAVNEKGVAYGEEKSFKMESLNGHDWVDLGLPSGLKWATCNVGASSPEDYGNYYAWGEISPKAEYTEENCLTDLLSISELQSQGIIDGNHNLTPSHDAATANWGGSWRMPTRAEQQELLDNCTWKWTAQNGVEGYKVTGPNGNSIFLPAAGYRGGSSLYYAGGHGRYWSSTPNESTNDSAYFLYFGSGGQSVGWSSRSYGQSVRPVAE